MKTAVMYCTCCGTLCSALAPEALEKTLMERMSARPALRNREPWSVAFLTGERLCDKEGADKALDAAREAGADGIVLAACSLSARGREAAKLLGAELPVSHTDVREGCAWIHGNLPHAAVGKAADLICMGMASLAARRVPDRTPPPAHAEHRKNALVIGAGPAGLACAAALGRMGVPTTLAERRNTVGGMLTQLDTLFPYLTSGPELLDALQGDLDADAVTLALETTVTGIVPVDGGYTVSLRGKGGETNMDAGAVIVAAGAVPFLPRGLFHHGGLDGVSSQMELEIRLAKVEKGEAGRETLPRTAVFLQCVGARNDDAPYCSAVCCPTALKNALRLRALVPGGSVTIVHRNMVTPGIHLEALYRRATAAGVLLRSFGPERAPEPLGNGSLTGLRFRDALRETDVEIPADMLVCSTPLRPSPGSGNIIKSLGLRADTMGFASGREPILPLAPHLPGVYVCGSARWPATIEQSLEQGRAAAARAAAYVGQQSTDADAARAWTVRELLSLGPDRDASARVHAQACSRCGRCVAACPYGACTLPEDGDAMRVMAGRCGRCGSCAAVCPSGAAALPGESMAGLRAAIHEAMGGKPV